MTTPSYVARRGELEAYFDRTAVEAWKRLTSDAPVNRIRATVRAGRDSMRNRLLSWLPQDLRGMRLLDAGCGTGALAIEAARRGADVVAVDISPTLIGLAQERAPSDLGEGRVTFMVGDLLDPAFGHFDHVVAMDSLIHYDGADIARTLAALAPRVGGSLVFTIAPRTPALTVMHAMGQFFPRGNRSPAIAPIALGTLENRMKGHVTLEDWRIMQTEKVVSGFYISQAVEARRP
ncbi:magnesium protoporphyrin IX methyltransferase [Methylocystis echinoides]|uniref:Magnesium protoporphyrin IX methyltransferase n=1 Tax=Methylocystis echinoides TaxID=29468 RepID=A0A9W6GXT3_9HYPH|nr:magnesium protoporphyrin IX methyltransferase [Methylocystis echinoides]GLI94840.1 magnesium protoporphyrin IX methyltransferase [Methylocystis echinoides]